jgi:hypothetical protein
LQDAPRDTLGRRGRRNGNEPQDTIVNSRNAYRNAQALAGWCAFACALPLSMGALPCGQAPDHRESEDRPDPGGCCV